MHRGRNLVYKYTSNLSCSFILSKYVFIHVLSKHIQTWQLSGRLCAAQLFTVQRHVQWCLTRAGLSLPASMIVNRKHLITIGHCCQCSLPFRITSVLSLGQSSLHIVLVRTFQPLLPEQDTRRSLSLVPWEIMICQCQAWSKPCSAVVLSQLQFLIGSRQMRVLLENESHCFWNNRRHQWQLTMNNEILAMQTPNNMLTL